MVHCLNLHWNNLLFPLTTIWYVYAVIDTMTIVNSHASLPLILYVQQSDQSVVLQTLRARATGYMRKLCRVSNFYKLFRISYIR